MKIALGSDIHLEFGNLEFTNEEGADVLVLAGDILIAQDLHDHTPESIQESLDDGNKLGKRQQAAIVYRSFLKKASEQFKDVIMVAGNHEFYHGAWNAALTYLKEECAMYPNIHFLENQTIDIDDVRFIGATLWTDMNKDDWATKYQVKQGMNDFRIIKNDANDYHSLHPDDVIKRHTESLAYIKNMVVNTSKKVVVVSHHAPSEKSTAPRYANHSLMNGAYRSNLEELMMTHTNLNWWFHGHTHNPFDYTVGNTRVVCNPRGYHGVEVDAYDFKFKYLDI